MKLVLPIKTVSEANQREHWRYKAKRAKAQRGAIALTIRRPELVPLRLHIAAGHSVLVTFVRIAPRELDDDNLQGAFKSIRDEVTAQLGLPNDRDRRFNKLYLQRRGAPNQYGVEIEIERFETEARAEG